MTRWPRSTAEGHDPLLARLERDTLLVGAATAAAAFILWPGRPQRALGVLAGVLLVAVAYLGIRAGVDALMPAVAAAARASDVGVPGETRVAAGRLRAPGGFVKFFTRHAILAASAYVMIARFELHPVALLAGVTTPAVAAGIEFVRIVRARGTGSH
jgi:hypothetical protein